MTKPIENTMPVRASMPDATEAKNACADAGEMPLE
jgi:hypothetical protein